MSLYRRGGVWWLDVYAGEGRRRVRKSTGTSDKVRARIIEQSVVALNRRITTRRRALNIIDNVLPPRERGLPLECAAAFYRECAAAEAAPVTRNTMDHRVNILSKFAMWAHDRTRLSCVDEVDAAAAFEFAKALGGGISARTKNAYVGDLGTAWRLFMRHGKAAANPWPLVRVPRDKAGEATGRAFTDDEIARISSAAARVGRDWPTAVMIALYTGLRQGDATSLRWEDVDFARREIRCRPSKTARRGLEVRIPLHRALARWLEDRRDNGSELVTPARFGRVGRTGFTDGDRTFNQILADAGVVRKDAREKLSFHCFRHTFVSRLARAGVAPDVRMRLAGHTTAENHAVYTHDEESERRAIDALP